MNTFYAELLNLFLSLKWLWIVAIIMIYRLLNKMYNLKMTNTRDKYLLEAAYKEDEIIGHLDYIINEALDQYVIFNIQPKNLYYINTKLETEIINYLSEKVPERLSSTLMDRLKLIYNNNYIGEFIGSRIYMIVLNYVLEYNVKNSPDDNAKNATNALIKNK